MADAYLAQCMLGEHIYEVVGGSTLEKECIEREGEGFLDAIVLSVKQCPNCLEERRIQLGHDANLCAEAGCAGFATYKECRENGGCLFVTELKTLKESEYSGMLRGMPRVEQEEENIDYDVFGDPEFNQDMQRGWVDYEHALHLEREQRSRAAATSAQRAAEVKCRRCKHPAKDHKRTSCGASTKKGSVCGCPGLIGQRD